MSNTTKIKLSWARFALQKEIRDTQKRNKQAIEDWVRMYGNGTVSRSREGFVEHKADWIRRKTMGRINQLQRYLTEATVKAALGFE